MTAGTLYLIPTTLGESALAAVIPQEVQQRVRTLEHFVAENPKTAREVEQRLANPAPAPGKAEQPDWQAKELEFRSRRVEAGQTEARQKQQEAAERRQCNQARDRLAQMKAARQMYRLNDKGEREYQGEEENRAAIAELERSIAQRCR